MQCQDVPAGASNGLGQVEVLLVAGKPVQKDQGGMRPFAAREIEQAVHSYAMAGYEDLRRAGRTCGIRCRICDDRGWNRTARFTRVHRAE
jgi:hypothetical protein